ncbi:hypothetical protein [Streptomyces griseoluteus]
MSEEHERAKEPLPTRPRGGHNGVTAERERLLQLQATAQGIVEGLPSWDGESPAVLVTIVDPVTRQRLGHWFTPATAAPQPQPEPGGRHLRVVRDAS